MFTFKRPIQYPATKSVWTCVGNHLAIGTLRWLIKQQIIVAWIYWNLSSKSDYKKKTKWKNKADTQRGG